MYYLERIGYLLFDGYDDSYRLSKNDSYKVSKYISAINGYLLELNNLLYEKSTKKTESFVYVEPKVEVEEKKEVDSEDESDSLSA